MSKDESIKWPKKWVADEGWPVEDDPSSLGADPRSWAKMSRDLRNQGSTLSEQKVALGAPGGLPPWGNIHPYLHRLMPRDAELLTFLVRDRKKQAEVATVRGTSQAAISIAFHAAVKRVEALSLIPTLSKREFIRDCRQVLSRQDLDILWRLYVTPNQLAVADELGLTYSKVHYRLHCAVQALGEDPRLAKYHKVYQAILNGSLRPAIRLSCKMGPRSR